MRQLNDTRSSIFDTGWWKIIKEEGKIKGIKALKDLKINVVWFQLPPALAGGINRGLCLGALAQFQVRL